MTSSHRDFVLGVAACLAVGATLVGCGGGGGGGGFPLLVPPAAGQPAAPPPPAPPPVAGLACEQLQGLAIPASAIGLPTSGASVTSAKTVAPGGTGAAALPEYCEVAGKIAPVDATAPTSGSRWHCPRHGTARWSCSAAAASTAPCPT
jgi:hypothetical protein